MVFAGTRDPAKSTALQALADASQGRVRLVNMDVADGSSCQMAAKEVQSLAASGVDYLIVNAGVNSEKPETTISSSL